MPPIEELIKYLWFIAFSSCAGLISYMTETHEKGAGFKVYDAFIKTIGSTFAGSVTLYGCLAFDASVGVMGAASGLAGWCGAAFMRVASEAFKSFVGGFISRGGK